MALYSIENDTCLGITHSGGAVNVESEGYVELSDEEVAKIVDLIRQKLVPYTLRKSLCR